jgi:hypothetical protein
MAASSLTSHADLGVRLRTLMMQDDAGGALEGLDKGSPGQLNDFEASCETWGFLYGMAFALARMEADPFEPNTDVGVHAHDVAWPEFLRYSGPFPTADRDVLVEQLGEAYEGAHEQVYEASRGSGGKADVVVTADLSKAINRLLSNGGRRSGKED